MTKSNQDAGALPDWCQRQHVRVYEIAKFLNISSREVIAAFKLLEGGDWTSPHTVVDSTVAQGFAARYASFSAHRGEMPPALSDKSQTSNRDFIAGVRHTICESAASLFRRPVSVEERAYQALEVVTKRGTTPTAAHVWDQLYRSVPAIQLLLEEIGVNFHNGRRYWPADPRPLDPSVHDLESIDWGRALRSVLCVEDASRRSLSYTTAGEAVAATGLLTIRELATGIFESGRISSTGTRLTNAAFRAIVRRMEGPSLKALAQAVGTDSLLANSYRAWRNVSDISAAVSRVFNRIYDCDPSCGRQQFILYHDGLSVRVAPFGVCGGYLLALTLIH